MYLPAHFRAETEAVRQLLEQVGAADLVTATSEGLMWSHIPILYDPEIGAQGAVLGHVARANRQWNQSVIGEALVIIHGPETYVTPSWYPSKAVDGRVVPTWNYSVVEVRGELIVHDDPSWKLDLVQRLTQKHESRRENPWSPDDAPSEFIDAQLRAVVGLEVRIRHLEGKAKWSQNREGPDREGVTEGLAADGLEEQARTMRGFL
jgi:transcriptional regulator